jgi:protein-disulfide isomerase
MKKYFLILLLLALPLAGVSADNSNTKKLPEIKITKPTSSTKIKDGDSVLIKWKEYKGDFDQYVIISRNKLAPDCTSDQIVPKTETQFNYSDEFLTCVSSSTNISLEKLRKNFYFEIQAIKNFQIVAKGESKKFSIVENKVKKSNKIDPYTVNSEDHFLTGNQNSKVIFVTYSDIECPFCRGFNVTLNKLSNLYGNKVAFVFRHMPLTQIHANANDAAIASECVAKLKGEKAFFQFLDKVFTGNTLGFDLYSKIASDLGVSSDKFTSCFYNKETQSKVDRDKKLGMEIAKTDQNFGTPYSLIISKKWPIQKVAGSQPIESVKSMIEKSLID